MKRYPLTTNQREILFHQELHRESPLYNIGGHTRIDGPVDVARFESALKAVISDCDCLRIGLIEENGGLVQTISEHLDFQLVYLDFSEELHPEEQAQRWIGTCFQEPFSYKDGGPLFQFALIKAHDRRFFWMMKYHHLIIDGWGTALIVRALASYYNNDHRVATPSYTAFIADDAAYPTTARYEAGRVYWQARFPDLPGALFAAKPVGTKRSSGWSTLTLKRAFYTELAQFARREGVSLFHFFLAACYTYFTRTRRGEELIIGVPVLNRRNASFKRTPGLFVGICPLYLKLGDCISFNGLLKAIRGELKANYRYQRFPISEINRIHGVFQKGREQLFDLSVSFEQQNYDVCFENAPVVVTGVGNGCEQTPLALHIRDFRPDLDVVIDIEYNHTYFDGGDIARFTKRFRHLLGEALSHPDLPMHQLSLMDETERGRLLQDIS